MENSNSNIMELRTDCRNKNIFGTKSRDRETQNDHSGKNGLRSANEMSQTVCLFRKYLLARAQHNIGKTNMEESEVINKSPYRHLLPLKLGRNSLSRPPSLLERKLFPEVRCDSVKSTQDSCANKASASSQFTIFYAGQVNVYDNVSAEKAQEVMMILGGEQSLSKPVSKEVPKTDARSSPPQKSDSQSVLYKSKPGVPLARKYSLQCFIEKRRDRIISKSPYAVVASSPSNDADKEASIDTELSESRRPSLSPFPSRLGYFFPVSANKGC